MQTDCTFILNGTRFTQDEFKKHISSNRDLIEKYQIGKKSPEMPFQKTWHEMALRRMLRYAAENGYDRMSWTTGEQQAARYDLSKHISEIHYSGTNLKAYDHAGKTVIEKTGVQPEDLPDIIGKEAAEKLMAQEPKGTLRSLHGQELKIGGEGMKGFYDKIIPDYLNKYGKKFGAKVEPVEINTGIPTERYQEREQRLRASVSNDHYGKEYQNLNQHEMDDVNSMVDEIIKGSPRKSETETVHSIPITPAMRKSVMEEGQPLFQSETDKTKSPEFKNWFGDSKVVDEKGNPLVVYHGGTPGIKEFDFNKVGHNRGRTEGAGIYFSDNKGVATGYSKGNKGLYPAYLNIKNPMPFDHPAFSNSVFKKILREAATLESKGNGASIADGFLSNIGDVRTDGIEKVLNEATELHSDLGTANDQIGSLYGAGMPLEYINKAVRKVTGYDGGISKGYENLGKGGGTIYTPWFPEQIKSINNTGEFNPSNKNIFHQQPLNQSPKGSFKVDKKTQTPIITLFRNRADISTVMHEGVHKIVADMIKAKNPLADKLLATTGQKNWNVPAHEAIATRAERYLYDGRAPNKELAPAFAQMKKSMASQYKEIKGTPLEAELKPEQRVLFDALFTQNKKLDQKRITSLVNAIKTASPGTAARLTARLQQEINSSPNQ